MCKPSAYCERVHRVNTDVSCRNWHMYIPFNLFLLLMIRIKVNVIDFSFVAAGFCEGETETSIKTKLEAPQKKEM